MELALIVIIGRQLTRTTLEYTLSTIDEPQADRGGKARRGSRQIGFALRHAVLHSWYYTSAIWIRLGNKRRVANMHGKAAHDCTLHTAPTLLEAGISVGFRGYAR
jgi:hypothetical protein